MSKGVPNADVISSCETKVPSTFQERDFGECGGNPSDRVVGRAVVHNNDGKMRVRARFKRLEALEGMPPSVPIQNDASYQKVAFHSNITHLASGKDWLESPIIPDSDYDVRACPSAESTRRSFAMLFHPMA